MLTVSISNHSIAKRRTIAAFIAVLYLLSGCSDTDLSGRDAVSSDNVANDGTLRIGTVDVPGTFILDEAGPTGVSKTLTEAFATSIGRTPEYVVYDSRDQLVEAVASREVHLGAGSLPVLEADRKRIRYGSIVISEPVSVVYRRGSLRPRAPEDLADREVIAAVTPKGFEPPTLMGVAPPLTALTAVDRREADAAIVLSRHLYGARLNAPALREGFALPMSVDTAWIFPRQGSSPIYRDAQRWLLESKRSGLLADLVASTDGHYLDFDHVAILLWRRHLKARLPKFEALFKEMAEQNQLDWRLLAAVSYQESHWNPKAVSPTGVRGLMMLTQATARQLGVKRRTDPRQSVDGGARYLRQLIERVPSAVHPNDRVWFALASYNIGFGHVLDAMMLTTQYARDPHYWHNLRQFLPLLEDAQYHRRTRYGYARGREPVRYVGNIRRFYEALRYETRRRAATAEQTTKKPSEN